MRERPRNCLAIIDRPQMNSQQPATISENDDERKRDTHTRFRGPRRNRLPSVVSLFKSRGYLGLGDYRRHESHFPRTGYARAFTRSSRVRRVYTCMRVCIMQEERAHRSRSSASASAHTRTQLSRPSRPVQLSQLTKFVQLSS